MMREYECGHKISSAVNLDLTEFEVFKLVSISGLVTGGDHSLTMEHEDFFK